MSFRGYFAQADLEALINAATQSGLVEAERSQRTLGIHAGFVAGIKTGTASLDRFEFELLKFNAVERLLDGSVPLALFLDNCASYLRRRGLPEADTFAKAANSLGNASSGVGHLLPAQTPPEITHPEAIVGRDEMLDFAFLSRGMTVGRSVGRILVPRFEQGVAKSLPTGGPWVMQGTAWVIAEGYVLTNHHVVNARVDGEPPASAADLITQTRSADLEFDFDDPGAQVTRTRIQDLVASDEALDYALLKVSTGERPALQRLGAAVNFGPAGWLPVNIIQHPRGGYKKIGIRSNLVTGATETELRYFTDTDIGSSGSPVCDDNWRVVALHRGALQVRGVKYYGKDTAYVNYGSQLSAILAHIATVRAGILPLT